MVGHGDATLIFPKNKLDNFQNVLENSAWQNVFTVSGSTLTLILAVTSTE